MKNFDVIIIGAGPAGIAAARTLDDKKINFCIIEKNKFPREKLCGGGLTSKSVNMLKKLNFNMDKIDTKKITQVEIHSKHITKELELNSNIITIDRFEFDFNNLKQVKCHIFENENIIDINDNTIKTEKNEYHFKYLIFADGVNGYSRRLIKDREFGFCVECNVNKLTDKTIFDFEAINNGYGWIFPKKKYTNIGLGNFNYKRKDYVDALIKFANKFNFEIEKNQIKGYHIPIFSENIYKQSVINNKYILVGDAAALVDAVSGEGIYYALKSGMYAALSIIEALDSKRNISDIYFEKTKDLAKSLEKRKKASKLLYSRFGQRFIKMGLNNEKFVEKLKRALG